MEHIWELLGRSWGLSNWLNNRDDGKENGNYYLGFRVQGHGDLVTGLLLGIIGVIIWLIGVISILTKSP